MRTIAILAFDEVEALDVIGPAEVFAKVRCDGEPAYRVIIVGAAIGEVRSESGLVLQVQAPLSAAEACDTLIVPGGRGLRDPSGAGALAPWLAAVSSDVRRVAAVCTGAYLLAQAGLLDGRRATTHWQFTEHFARCFPKVRLDPDALYVRDGSIFSSAGLLAGIDMALALISEDVGSGPAAEVARELVIQARRPGDAPQQSAMLKAQGQIDGGLADLGGWITTHLAADLRVEALAARVALSPRQFARRFSAAYGAPPAYYVASLRADAARQLIAAGGRQARVAAAVGLGSASELRRLLRRRTAACAAPPASPLASLSIP